MLSATRGSSTVSYLYNHEGARVEKSLGAVRTSYPSSYFSQTNTGTSTTFVMLGNQNLATITNGTVLFNHTDHLGSTIATTNETGGIVETTDYSAFGHQTQRSTFVGTQQTEKYTGHTYDPETDLLYAQARYYRGSLGRFLSQDPLHWQMPKDYLVDPQQQNSYSYGRNNPIKYIDLSGEKVELVAKQIAIFGNHLFYRVTPDNPDQIRINGVPVGATEFTIGAYNPDGNNPFSNRLEKAIGYEGHSGKSTDYGIEGRASITLTPPNNMSDTEFINSLGSAYNTAPDGQNYVFTGPGSDGYSNSNNFVYDVGSRVGVQDQVSGFKPNWYSITPGNGKSLAVPNQPSKTQQVLNSVRQVWSQVKSVFKKEGK